MRSIRRVITVVLFIMAAVVMNPDFSAVDAVELDKGAALRQNVLLFRWPSDMRDLVANERSFGISETRARLWSTAEIGNGTLHAALETRANFLSSASGEFGMFSGEGSLLGQSRPLRHWDMTFEHIDGERTSLISRIDRLDYMRRIGAVDIDVGRQPLSVGTSHFVGVLDVIAPFAPGDLDATYKPGVDAVRIRKGIGMTGEAEIIAVASEEWEEGALLGRFRSSYGIVDIEVVGGRFHRRAYGGVGWEGGTNPIGFWGELALFERLNDREKYRGGWSEAAFSTVAGLDYYIEADFVLGGALMFQDFGARKPEELVSVYNDAPFREGWVFLGSAGYGVLTLSKELHPLVQADAAGLVNLTDNSTLWQPRITVNTGNNTDMSLYGWIGTGKSMKVVGGKPEMRSEFGSMPAGGGFYARWFF